MKSKMVNAKTNFRLAIALAGAAMGFGAHAQLVDPQTGAVESPNAPQNRFVFPRERARVEEELPGVVTRTRDGFEEELPGEVSRSPTSTNNARRRSVRQVVGKPIRSLRNNDFDRLPAQDREEGWVVRQTENGLVKVPAKQYFRFEGLSLTGKAYTPFQAVFDQRPTRKSKSLIPVRTSFKREVLDASGYSGR